MMFLILVGDVMFVLIIVIGLDELMYFFSFLVDFWFWIMVRIL